MTKLWKRNFGQNTSDVFSISFISLFMDNNKNYIRKIVSIGESRIVCLDVVIGDNEAKDMREYANARSCRNV